MRILVTNDDGITAPGLALAEEIAAEIAGPGFINLRLADAFWHARLAEVLRDPQHPKHVDTARFIVEKILPSRSVVEAEVRLNPTGRDAETQAELAEMLVQIAGSMRQLSEAQAGQPGWESRVRIGPDALLRASIPAEKEPPR